MTKNNQAITLVVGLNVLLFALIIAIFPSSPKVALIPITTLLLTIWNLGRK